jgi:Fe-S oxidoreductase
MNRTPRPIGDAHTVALETCAYCPKLCRFACPVAEAETREAVTPWGLLGRAEHLRRGHLPLDAQTAEVWTHCTGCGRCVEACRHANPVPETVFALRAAAQRENLLPSGLAAWADTPPEACPELEALPPGGPWVVLPGHAPAEVVRASLALLDAATGAPLGRAPGGVWQSGVRWIEAGQPERGAEMLARAVAALQVVPHVVALDPADLAPLGARLGAAVTSLPEALLAHRTRLEPRLRRVVDGPVLYLDACRLGRSGTALEAPRALLRRVTGGVVEAPAHGAEAGCCGAGAGYAALHPDRAARVARDAVDGPVPGLDRASAPGIPLVSVSPTCAAHLRVALAPREVHDWSTLLWRGLRGVG